jgi:hypothetical protein
MKFERGPTPISAVGAFAAITVSQWVKPAIPCAALDMISAPVEPFAIVAIHGNNASVAVVPRYRIKVEDS